MRKIVPILLVVSGGMVCWKIAATGGADESRPSAVPAGHRATARPVLSSRGLIAGDWQDLLARCRAAEDPAALKRQLAATRNRWLEKEPDLAAREIARLLQGGDDAATGIDFESGPGGSLRGWPTLRVFLLDMLSATDPDLAVEIAREILSSTTSAEEFAVALKPLLLGGPWKASDEELQAHFSKLLGNAAWQNKVGLAEALDLSRVAASSATTEILARWVDASPSAVEAGKIALHETAARHPALLVGLIAASPDLLVSHPDLRAELMARAAVSDPGQAAGVENYLGDPAVPITEKQRFIQLFPLRSATTGYRLYGTPPAPFEKAQVRVDDQAALEAANRWKSDPGLEPLAADLRALENRLQGWVWQAGN